MLTLYDAARCPYCARVRIVLAEKGLEHETVEIDLGDHPAWLYDKNPTGRVPVLEEDDFAFPESRVIMEYLEERYPDPPVLPHAAADRGVVRLWLERFDGLTSAYYAVVLDGETTERLDAELTKLESVLAARPYFAGADFSLADVGYVPWIIRTEGRTDVDLGPYQHLQAWLARLAERRSIAAELELVGAATASTRVAR